MSDVAAGVVDGGAGDGQVGFHSVVGAARGEVRDFLEVHDGVDLGDSGIGDCEVFGLVGGGVPDRHVLVPLFWRVGPSPDRGG